MWQPTFLATAVLTATVASGQVPPPDPQQVGYEVLARGPVHEAFASVVDGKSSATPVVPQPPPPPVNELPPDIKPAGDDVEWVGGYWYWSDERAGFLWVSGCWREAPPGRDWLPGQWVRVADGYHWVSGVWLPEGTTQLTLLPQPPAPIEEDPGQPPAANQVFVPGTWVWRENRYVWRPGRWVEEPADWVWQPAQYVWTPNGYLFVDGFWDHPLAERGFLYAPAVFNVATVNRVVYVPQFVVRPAFLTGALFVRAATKHYYFGDYFEPRYQTAGFVPWFDYRTSRVAIDPLFAHYRAYQRQADWERTVRALYAARYAGQAARPPRTWAQQQEAARAAGQADAARLAPLVSVQPTAGTPAAAVQQTIQNIQNVTNLKVERVADERKARYKEAADRRRQAAQSAQESQTQRAAQQGKAAAPPKAPVGINVPTLPRATRPAPQPTPAPKPSEPKPQTPPPVTPPKPPVGQPPTTTPPTPKPKPPTTPPTAPPVKPIPPAKTPPPAAPPPVMPPAKKAPPPPKFPAEKESPRKAEPPGKGKGDEKAGKGKGDEKKKDDKKKDG